MTHQPEELLISSLLSTAVNDHVAQLTLLPRLDIELKQLVDGLLKVQGRLDGEVRLGGIRLVSVASTIGIALAASSSSSSDASRV